MNPMNMGHSSNRFSFFLFATHFVLGLSIGGVYAQTHHIDEHELVQLRQENLIRVPIKPSGNGALTLPRLAAPLKSIEILTDANDGPPPKINFVPEQDYWSLKWAPLKRSALIELKFEGQPQLLSELESIKCSSDGSFLLPAHRAHTSGSKVRYEPQPFKNTVGYWVGEQDYAQWTIHNEREGNFNVAILQGCGKGQGGSTARISFQPLDDTGASANLEFTVVETGHFQNFQWFNLGTVSLSEAAIAIKIEPVSIAKNALMDVRAVHLIRLPQ